MDDNDIKALEKLRWKLYNSGYITIKNSSTYIEKWIYFSDNVYDIRPRIVLLKYLNKDDIRLNIIGTTLYDSNAINTELNLQEIQAFTLRMNNIKVEQEDKNIVEGK